MNNESFPFLDPTSEANFEELVREIRGGYTTLLIGAGLALRAGLPSWQVLLEFLLSKASLPPVQFNPRFASDQFEEVKCALGETYVSALRESLDPPNLSLPNSYRVLGAVPFRRFATTNLDELLYYLAVAVHGATDDQLAEYPNRDIEDKIYVYLHGRLKSATDGRNLVLCTSDYDVAYNMGNGATQVVIRALLGKSLLFVGSSLEDPILRRLLDETRRSIASDLTIGGKPTASYRVKPPWFAILPANPCSLLGYSKELSNSLNTHLPPDITRRMLLEKAVGKARISGADSGDLV